MTKNSFDGWYFKHQNESQTLALIPAAHHAGTTATASLQIITNKQAYWCHFDSDRYAARRKSMRIRIGDSLFTPYGVDVHVEDEGVSLHGRLQYGVLTPLQSDIMGCFRYVPGLTCRHGVHSMTHTVNGELILNGEPYLFKNGTGYIESDRGSSFPSCYLWTQCNRLDDDCQIMLSIADIPLGIFSFWGCICSIRYHKEEFRLATYQGVKIIEFGPKIAEIKQGDYRLYVELLSSDAKPLAAPINGSMTRIIYENPSCTVRYRFYKVHQLIFDLTSSCAGFEYDDGNKTVMV